MSIRNLYSSLLTAGIILYTAGSVRAQCTTNGQTPATAFPVCAIKPYSQTNVPFCRSNNLFVPGCSGDGNNYENKNPFFYKFTCYVSGSLGFVITPLAPNEDYDWQLYDITGKNPDAIFTDNSTIVTGNWAGTYGPTGASATGVGHIECASIPDQNKPTFSAMPNLIAGHEYLLMISHYSDTPSGYELNFTGGSAVITDPLMPHMKDAESDCTGTKITLRLNKKILCRSLSADGSDFVIPGGPSVISATTFTCAAGFDFDSVVIELNSALSSGTHQLRIKKGGDGNTLLDICENAIPDDEFVSFDYFIPQPILADSVAKPACAPDSIRVHYPKKIRCSTVSATGAEFTVTGPTPVTVVGASGNCVDDLTPYIIVKFATPIYRKGNYTVAIQPGIDGSPVLDVCGQPILAQTLPFSTADTVFAQIDYTSKFGCQRDTLTFSHNGAHDVNSWNWVFNNGTPITTQTHSIIWPAKSNNTVQLIVSNGVCRDTSALNIDLDNEVKAQFDMPDIICPEDRLQVINRSTGTIDRWRWNFDLVGTSPLKDPPPFLMPTTNHEAYYTIKLVATNTALNCSDSVRKTLTVLDNCLIAVPTAFTPNGDGLNDFFWPHNAIKADNLDFRVYNRWGQLVFQSGNWRSKWDGTLNGVAQTTGVYVWMLRYTHRETRKQVFQKGTVALIR